MKSARRRLLIVCSSLIAASSVLLVYLVGIPGVNSPRVSSGADPAVLTRLAERCIGQADANMCLMDRLDDLAIGAGLNSAIVELGLLERNPAVAAACHTISHELGRRAYRRSADLAGTISSAKPSCQGGFVHGLLESAGDDLGSSGIAELSARACSGLRGDQRGSCEHGLGHAAFQSTDGDADLAVTLCDSLPGAGAQHCRDGVFMAAATDGDAERSLAGSRTCLTQANDSAARACLINSFLGVGFEEVDRSGGVPALQAFCDRLPTATRVSCYSGLGYASRSLVRTDAESQRNQLLLCGGSSGEIAIAVNPYRSCLWYVIEQNTALHDEAWFDVLCRLTDPADLAFCQSQVREARQRFLKVPA